MATASHSKPSKITFSPNVPSVWTSFSHILFTPLGILLSGRHRAEHYDKVNSDLNRIEVSWSSLSDRYRTQSEW